MNKCALILMFRRIPLFCLMLLCLAGIAGCAQYHPTKGFELAPNIFYAERNKFDDACQRADFEPLHSERIGKIQSLGGAGFSKLEAECRSIRYPHLRVIVLLRDIGYGTRIKIIVLDGSVGGHVFPPSSQVEVERFRQELKRAFPNVVEEG